MDDREAGRYWEQNAPTWTLLSRQGWDVYRDLVNTPAFLDLLPDVSGLTGLDLGCGEGHNTRLLARRGAKLCAIDISPAFIHAAKDEERRDPLGLRYYVSTALQLPFRDAEFDFVTAFMSLMDMPRPERALQEARRVLKPGGFLQFSISHPCFDTPHRKLVRSPDGTPYALEVAGYFEDISGRIDEWLFSAAPRELRAGLPPFRIPRFHRPISEWINNVLGAGFDIERVAEPRAGAETAARFPVVADTRIVGYFLHVRCRRR